LKYTPFSQLKRNINKINEIRKKQKKKLNGLRRKGTYSLPHPRIVKFERYQLDDP